MGISSKVNTVARVEFELTYLVAAGKYFNHFITLISLQRTYLIDFLYNSFILKRIKKQFWV